MKKIGQYISIIFLLTLFGAKGVQAQHHQRHIYRGVVIERPLTPRTVVRHPIHLQKNQIWVEGSWRWNKRLHQYVWLDGYTIRARQHKVWVCGSWKSTGSGWVYINGFWA